MSLGRRRLRMLRISSEGRSKNVAYCFEAASFWWRFFWSRSRRLERSSRDAVVSTRGSSPAGISLRIAALVRGTLVMAMIEWQRRTEKTDDVVSARELEKFGGFSGVIMGS